MRVLLAKNAGTCYGVDRALNIANSVAKTHAGNSSSAQKKQKKTDEETNISPERNEVSAQGIFAQTLGPLIHNPRVVQNLERVGIGVANSIDEVCTDTVILRSHGVMPSVRRELERMGVHIEDATCPYVLRAQKSAYSLAVKYGCVVVIGAAGHPEVEGLIAYARLGCEKNVEASGSQDYAGVIVVSCAEDLPEKLPACAGVVVQTTQSMSNFEEVICALKEKKVKLDVKNTICSATAIRQESAADMAKRVDGVVVVGGKNSSNTTQLFQICKQVCPNTHHIEDACELCASMFSGCNVVGVSAGASTPEEQICEVIQKIETF